MEPVLLLLEEQYNNWLMLRVGAGSPDSPAPKGSLFDSPLDSPLLLQLGCPTCLPACLRPFYDCQQLFQAGYS